jgi:hypothetical protein
MVLEFGNALALMESELPCRSRVIGGMIWRGLLEDGTEEDGTEEEE